jgi:hypothetical protein
MQYKQTAAVGRAMTKMAGSKANVEPMLNNVFKSSTGRSLAPNLSSLFRRKTENDQYSNNVIQNVHTTFGAMGTHSHFRKKLIAALGRGLPGLPPTFPYFLPSPLFKFLLLLFLLFFLFVFVCLFWFFF